MNSSEFLDKKITNLSKSKSHNFISFTNSDDEVEDAEDGSHSFGYTTPRGTHLRSNSPMDQIALPRASDKKVVASGNLAVISLVDKKMKEHTEKLQHAMACLSARITQLDSRVGEIENSIDDLKVSIENNHVRTNRKLMKLENISGEIQGGIKDLRDKQEIAEAQMQLAKLLLVKDQSLEKQNSKVESSAKDTFSSAPYQATSSPVLSSQQLCSSLPNASSSPFSQNPLPTVTVNFPIQPQPNLTPSRPLSLSYHSPQVVASDTAFHQYSVHSSQQLHPSPPAPNQPSRPLAQFSTFSESSCSSQLQLPVGVVDPRGQYPYKHHPEEISYMSSQSYPVSTDYFPQQPDRNAALQHFHMGSAQRIHNQPANRPNSDFYSQHLQSSQYANYEDPVVKHFKMSASSPQLGENRHKQLPTALPTASYLDDESGSSETGGKIQTDDVVDRIVAMGFPRDVVRATVRKLKENGQQADPNVVLDKLMNDG